MVIPGYNDGQPVKVVDRGGAIRGDKLDVFFHSHQVALEWGVQYLDVQVRSD
jgi:3D (Asp-Asp-Asp) domain-containing protein